MEKRISERIYDLYQIREDPIRNLDKIQPILNELREFGIEYPQIPRYPYYESNAKKISIRLHAFDLLRDCLRRFLSEGDRLETEEARELRDYAANFHSKLQDYIEKSEEQYKLLRFTITEENKKYFEDILQKLIGVRLEYELIPNLFESMSFEKNTTTFNIDGEVIEIDGRYERKSYSGAKAERLKEKEVVLVECATTVDLGKIKKFKSKVKIIKTKYMKDKRIWNYDNLDLKAWLVACYGWSKKLIDEAKARGIIPITPLELEKLLKQNGIFDPRIPICPSNQQALT